MIDIITVRVTGGSCKNYRVITTDNSDNAGDAFHE